MPRLNGQVYGLWSELIITGSGRRTEQSYQINGGHRYEQVEVQPNVMPLDVRGGNSPPSLPPLP